jgi:hypothetical protein
LHQCCHCGRHPYHIAGFVDAVTQTARSNYQPSRQLCTLCAASLRMLCAAAAAAAALHMVCCHCRRCCWLNLCLHSVHSLSSRS